jgi:hypothetical protein
MANHVIRDRIWVSKKLRRCTLKAALAYPWLFLVADDWGRFEYDPPHLWSVVFAARSDVSLDDVTGWLQEYEREQLLVRYENGGELAFWTGFEGRPPSKRRPSKHIDPETVKKAPNRKRLGTVRVPVRKDLGTLDQESLIRKAGAGEQEQESRAGEQENSNGLSSSGSEDSAVCADAQESDAAEKPAENGLESTAIAISPPQRVFNHWREACDHKAALFTAKRRTLIAARLREGYTVDQLMLAVDGCRGSPFHQGENKHRKVYDSIELICRDGQHVESFMEQLKQRPARSLLDDPDVQAFIRGGNGVKP